MSFHALAQALVELWRLTSRPHIIKRVD